MANAVIIRVELHDGDLDLIRRGKLDFRRAIMLVLNHEHPFEVLRVEDDEKVEPPNYERR